MVLNEALQKAARYCARQERCHQEVRDKLYQWGLYGEEAEVVITELISSGFLNEQRFAEAFAIGKFRQKYWGKRKIMQGLKVKRIPEVLIEKGIAAISQEEYIAMIMKVAQKRALVEKATDPFTAKQRIIKYLIQRGFEAELVRNAIDQNDSFT